MFKSGRVIGGFTGFVNRFLILILSAICVTLAVKPELAGVANIAQDAEGTAPLLCAETVEKYRFLIAAAALVLFILNLNVVQFIFFNIWNNDSRRYIASKTASGTARVSLDAIQRSLLATANAMPEIARCRLEAYRIGHKQYKVEVFFWMIEGQAVTNVSEKLRLVLKKRFSDLVSISPQDRVDFDITLAGIQKHKKITGPARGEGVGLAGRFQGRPVYPVDEES